MIRQGLIEQEVLHEIAMSIGESIELDAMLAECIPIFLRGLGCATAVVLLKDEADQFYTPNFILPRAAMRNKYLHQAIEQSISYLNSQQPLPVPLCYFDAIDVQYYAWPIKNIGAILMGRSAPIRDGLYKEILPLANKLALAVASCQQYERLKSAQKELITARDEAQSANRAKSSFLATMSHEIRTPLNAVINLSEILLETSQDERQKKLTQGVCEGGKALLQLVNDVLDFSRIEAGKLELVPTTFNLRDLLEGIFSLYEKQAQSKALFFRLNISPDVPNVVTTDPSRLRQVIQNLLSNAIKFTESGGISMNVSFQQNTGIPVLSFYVSDTGIGISKPQVQQLFREFTQLDTDLDRRFGGSGLGLAIAHRLVMMMGGKIQCQSSEGIGSTFWFFIPLHLKAIRSTPEILHYKPAVSAQILLVEDSLTNQMVATAMLEKLDCSIRIANNGFEAIEQIKTKLPDLVLMDVSMPGMDGLQATKLIREMGGSYASLPIIAMTAHAFEHDRQACFDAGMDDYLSKPLQKQQLTEMISLWMSPNRDKNKEDLIEKMHQQTATAFVGTTKPILDETTVTTLLQETSADLVKKLAGIFLKESRDHLSALAEKIEAKDLDAAAKHAHAVKSSSGALGVLALQDMCSQIEKACRTSGEHIPALYQATMNVAEASWQALQQRHDI